MVLGTLTGLSHSGEWKSALEWTGYFGIICRGGVVLGLGLVFGIVVMFNIPSKTWSVDFGIARNFKSMSGKQTQRTIADK